MPKVSIAPSCLVFWEGDDDDDDEDTEAEDEETTGEIFVARTTARLAADGDLMVDLSAQELNLMGRAEVRRRQRNSTQGGQQ